MRYRQLDSTVAKTEGETGIGKYAPLVKAKGKANARQRKGEGLESSGRNETSHFYHYAIAHSGPSLITFKLFHANSEPTIELKNASETL